MTPDEQRAETEPHHSGTVDRRVFDRELRERVLEVERDVRKLREAMFGGEDGYGLRHEIKELKDLMGQLLASDRKRLPTWAVVVLWLTALGIGGVIAWASTGAGR